MSQTFNEQLNQILPKLISSDLLTNQGLGNEIGFWIFDYPPEEEMAMRAFLHDVVMPSLGKHLPPIRAADVNLFDLVIGLLEERKILDKAIEMQRTQGDAKTLESLRRVLKEDKLAERLVTQYPIADLLSRPVEMATAGRIEVAEELVGAVDQMDLRARRRRRMR